MPSASDTPHCSPAADSVASSGPDRIRIAAPGMRSRSAATNASPLLASRTAAVASTSNGSARIAWAMAW